VAWISTDEWEVTGQAALVAWHFYFSSRTRNQFFRNSTLCRWISRSRRFGISWMIFPSRINQSKRMISTKQTLSHHKKLESPQIPMYQPRILHTMPEFGFRNWGKPYNRSVMTTDQRICQIQVTSVDDRAKPRSSNVDVTSLMQGTKTTRSSPLFLLLRFENATRTTQMRWRRKFLPTFCVGGGGGGYSERMKATMPCYWHQTHFPKQEFCLCRYAIYRPPCWAPTLHIRPC